MRTLAEEVKDLGLNVPEMEVEVVGEAIKIVKKKTGTDARKKSRENRKNYRKNKAKILRQQKKYRKTAAGKRTTAKRDRFKDKKGTIRKGFRVMQSSVDHNINEYLNGLVEEVQNLSDEVFKTVKAIDLREGFEKAYEVAKILGENYKQLHEGAETALRERRVVRRAHKLADLIETIEFAKGRVDAGDITFESSAGEEVTFEAVLEEVVSELERYTRFARR